MSMELDTLLPGVTQHPPPESYVEIDKRQKLEPEAEEESESQSNSESESESEWEPEPWSLKRIEDLVESDFYMYNDDSNPYLFSCSRFEYKNKAQIKKEEQVEKAVAEYEERSRNLTPFDAIPVPPLANIFGNNWPKPITITDDVRPLLIHLSNLALEIYNQGTANANYVFNEIVKATSQFIPYGTHYITFEAKDAAHVDPFNSPITTFQAHVWNRRPEEGQPVVKSCSIKPK
ncbi:uncharacterized protein LOC131627134 isoform X2 [Vicia villosa]|uniref:uncharacterized protein LOC131627134 isoform X2 n=1 Tax=Vicia villosa TaxID=3911 RepID=UPI00273CCE0E|nr:uncharacterized protein LOC131627134 isoform X2 [Vicia villosa]